MKALVDSVGQGETSPNSVALSNQRAGDPLDVAILDDILWTLLDLSPSARALFDHLLAALESAHAAGIADRPAISRVELARRLGKARLTPGDLERLDKLRALDLIVEDDRLLPDGGKLRVYSIPGDLLVPLMRVRKLGADELRAAVAGALDGGAADELDGGIVGALRAAVAGALDGGAAGAVDELRAGAAPKLDGGAAGAVVARKVDELRARAADAANDASVRLKAERLARNYEAFLAELDAPSLPAARVVRARRSRRRWRGLRRWQVAVLVVLALAVVVLVVLAGLLLLPR